MALNPASAYPGQIDTTDPTGYPYGRAKNVVAIGDGTGTPLEQKWVSDLFGFWQSLLAFAGITPSGTPDKVGASQYLAALLLLGDSRAKLALRKSQALNWPERSSSTDSYGVNNVLGLGYAPDLGVGGGGLWVAQTQDTTVLTSEDGNLWTSRGTLSAASFTNPWIAYGKINSASGFLLSQNANPGVYYTSTDGITWSLISTSAVPANPVSAYSPSLGLWVMAGNNGAVRTSPTALANTWTARTTSVPWQVAVSTQGVKRIAYNGALFVVLPVNSQNRFTTSPDGVTWTDVLPGTTQNWVGIAYSTTESLWMAVADSGAVVTSPDGITWTVVGAGPGYGATDLAVNGSLWVMSTRTAAVGGIAFSVDKGATWTQVAVGNHRVATAGWNRILAADNRFLVAHLTASAIEFAFSQRAL